MSKTIDTGPVLAAIGITGLGHRTVLGLQVGDKGSAPFWRQMFKNLKKRCHDGTNVDLGNNDGLPGLEMVFKEEFPNARVQRYEVHAARQVLSIVPKKLKKDITDEVCSIFYAFSRQKTVGFFMAFIKSKWEIELPSAVKCLETLLDSCLTYFYFPQKEGMDLFAHNQCN